MTGTYSIARFTPSRDGGADGGICPRLLSGSFADDPAHLSVAYPPRLLATGKRFEHARGRAVAFCPALVRAAFRARLCAHGKLTLPRETLGELSAFCFAELAEPIVVAREQPMHLPQSGALRFDERQRLSRPVAEAVFRQQRLPLFLHGLSLRTLLAALMPKDGRFARIVSCTTFGARCA